MQAWVTTFYLNKLVIQALHVSLTQREGHLAEAEGVTVTLGAWEATEAPCTGWDQLEPSRAHLTPKGDAR